VLETLTATGWSPAEGRGWEIERLRRGDERAFEALYRSHTGAVFGLALRLTGRPADAEELTQEVFVRAWENRCDFESPDHFRRWLRKVAVNHWLTQTRRQRPAALDDEDFPEPEDPQSRRAAASPGLKVDLERAIAALPARLRAVLVLFDVYGCRHDEVAELLEVTEGSSKVLLHRARRRLKEML
jgi:RNA polymerase sigma-70 factor (ECF subfamily)